MQPNPTHRPPLTVSSVPKKMHRLKPSLQFFKSSSFHHLKPFSAQTPLQSAGPLACRLETRSVIRFKGPDTIKFLQGLVTNDVRGLAHPEPEGENSVTPNMPVNVAPPVYAAMLTPQGRFLYDFVLYRAPRPEETLDRTGSGPGPASDELDIYADVDKSVLDELLATLKKYRLRSKVDIENLEKDFSCWQQFGGKLGEESSSPQNTKLSSVGTGAGIDLSGSSASQGSILGWQWNKDPRLACLGYRGIFPSNTPPPVVEADKETEEGNYHLWRLEKGVAEGSNEIPKGEAIPLEYNLAGLNAISFDKGCYIGQELIARTHHRGVIRKRLIPLRFVNDTGNEAEKEVTPGSEVIDRSSQKKVGEVRTALGSHGMGVLRLDEAFKQNGKLTIKGMEDIHVETIRPEWWPVEWFMDHQQQHATA